MGTFCGTGAPRQEQQNTPGALFFCFFFFAIKPRSSALPEFKEVWRKERGSSQGGEKSPESINIHRCSLAATAHTKAPVQLQGCQEGSAQCSAKPGETPRAVATSSCSAGWERAPTAPQEPAWCPAHLCALPGASPLRDRHCGLGCSFSRGFCALGSTFHGHLSVLKVHSTGTAAVGKVMPRLMGSL